MQSSPRHMKVQCISPVGLHHMAYTEWGDPANPKVLVCVHGLTRVGADFDELAAAMSDHYRVVCPDVVGRGDSDWLPDGKLYQYPLYVADMVTLLARLNANTLHWFGTSMGGLIGMSLASLPHSPIDRLVLNDVGPVLTAVSLERIGSYVGQNMHFDDFAGAEAYIRRVAATFHASSDAQWQKLTRDATRPAPGGGLRLHYDPKLGDAFRGEQAGPITDVVLWNYYDQIKCPVLAVRGELSDLLTPATHKEMSERGPHARLAVIQDVGHAPMFVTPDQIAIARDFLLES